MKNDTIGAEMSLKNDRMEVHPVYTLSDDQEVPEIWHRSYYLRELLRKKEALINDDIDTLKTSINRQVRTTQLYKRVSKYYPLVSIDNSPKDEMSLYVLLFPGSTKDNTGIKDLNDKILYYEKTSEYLSRRDKLIIDIFQPDFNQVGGDYKTATFLSINKERNDFETKLHKLDLALKYLLLEELLPDAEKEAKEMKEGDEKKKRLRSIRTLTKALKKKNYRFDIFFGLITVEPFSLKVTPIELTFLIFSEALKAAAIARIISKGETLKTTVARNFVKRIKSGPKKFDSRGKSFDWPAFFYTFKIALDIKEVMTSKTNRKNTANYYPILIDEVWTGAFSISKRLFIGNPNVIRDVRKNRLARPRLRDRNFHYRFSEQKELLELWLFALNMVDFVPQQFLEQEFPNTVTQYHDRAIAAFNELQSKKKNIDWSRLISVLSQDINGQTKAVLGTASEYMFYAGVADYEERIFFSMDIRDLGVELVLFYEYSNGEVVYRKYGELDLMKETFRANQPIIMLKREAYNSVKKIFKEYHSIILASESTMPNIFESIHIMLGGDEIFVSAHPYFSAHETEIVKSLDEALNVRTAVTYSKAEKKQSSDKQRYANQRVHSEGLELANKAPGTLKEFERRHRRITRLIQLVEGNKDNKDKAPELARQLNSLKLSKMYGRAKHVRPKLMKPRRRARLLEALRNENPVAAAKTNDIEYVDYSGFVYDEEALKALFRKATSLQEKVKKIVGSDNTHIDVPLPDKDLRPIIKKVEDLIEKIWKPKPIPKSKP